MGVCQSNTASGGDPSNGGIEGGVKKVLLLGPGESGKSTVFNNCLRVYDSGFSETRRADAAVVIYSNVLLSMKKLCEETKEIRGKRAREAKAYMDQKVTGSEELDEVLAASVLELWEDPDIQETYNNRASFQLDDNAAYFFNKVHDLAREGYEVEDTDILLSRVRTTGIVDHDFHISDVTFRMMDMGGQRGERIKWAKAFDQVHGVVFVASLSEYDQTCREDNKTNRLVEAIALFEDVSSHAALADAALVLVLTKGDLLRQKLKRHPLRRTFKDYSGKTYDEAVQFIASKFASANKKGQPLVTVTMSATESNVEQNLDKVMAAILAHQSNTSEV